MLKASRQSMESAMARPLRIEYPGAFYHVTARGNEQKDIFKSRRDREQFLSYLESAAVRYGAVIHLFLSSNPDSGFEPVPSKSSKCVHQGTPNSMNPITFFEVIGFFRL